jgi:myo-inositol-1(or 4)-monophosphatase
MTSHSDVSRTLMPLVREAAREAGALAMRHFRSGQPTSAKIWSKAGGSPVTEADVAVDTFLKIKLSAAVPGAGWLSEETADDGRRIGRDLVWIVDPIDGTRAFLSGSPDWSVAIALLQGNRPTLGIVYAPAHEAMFEAQAGHGAFRDGHRIDVSRREQIAGASVAGPVPFIERLERRAGSVMRPPRIPSLALRIARVAEGSVDLGLISGNARDWDIAAADLILVEAGGWLGSPDGAVPRYNEADPVHGELIAAPKLLHRSVIEAITQR